VKLRDAWSAHLERLVREKKTSFPLKRLRHQAEQDPVFKETLNRWSSLGASDREAAWEKLTEAAVRSTREVLPVCVRCGDCCRKGSPTLMREDLERVREGNIPWEQLVTLRPGEPVRSPFTGSLFHLQEERIKIREREGSRACFFLDEETGLCTRYEDRPAQCRVQVCWDPEPARALEERPHLTRRDLFRDVEDLVRLFDEHDRRCSFTLLREAFEALSETKGERVDPVIEILAFDDHIRSFVVERFEVFSETLDLLFGRSLSRLARLFGFRVEASPDGTRTLLQVPSDS
jgi:Fe-S-cluster containining protein